MAVTAAAATGPSIASAALKDRFSARRLDRVYRKIRDRYDAAESATDFIIQAIEVPVALTEADIFAPPPSTGVWSSSGLEQGFESRLVERKLSGRQTCTAGIA